MKQGRAFQTDKPSTCLITGNNLGRLKSTLIVHQNYQGSFLKNAYKWAPPPENLFKQVWGSAQTWIFFKNLFRLFKCQPSLRTGGLENSGSQSLTCIRITWEACQTQMAEPHPQSWGPSLSAVGHRNLHYQQVSSKCCCCWSSSKLENLWVQEQNGG